jgi:peptide/nickel transport system permease protein
MIARTSLNYAWVARKAVYGLVRLSVTMICVLLIAFILVRLSPYSPVTALVGGHGTVSGAGVQAQIKYWYSLYPTGPLYLQFLNWFWLVIHGNLGHSIISGQSVTGIIAESLPWTLLIVLSSTIISFVIGIVFGMILAYRRKSTMDTAGSTFATVLYSIPIYVVALALFIGLTFVFPLFPHAGAYDITDVPGPNLPFIISVLYHAVLPILTLVIASVGSWTLLTRASTVSVLGEDYVLAAEARGISSSKIAMSYVGKNAILPQYTNLMLSLGFSFAGAVFVETIFTYPGMGYQLINAIELNNYPVVMGVFITFILAVVICLFIADMTYGLIDPRARN